MPYKNEFNDPLEQEYWDMEELAMFDKEMNTTEKSSIKCFQCEFDGTERSSSKVVFKVEFLNGTSKIMCTYCMTEFAGEHPEKIKTITNIGEAI